MSLHELAEHACEHLPDGWRIRIDLEKHSGAVTAIRPDDTEVQMDDRESELDEQVRAAVHLARDEESANETLNGHQPKGGERL
jgi:hypothetical protein